ncbi:uncharacterized protein MYCFIDRAFT_203484 [Pseudocercospora fijiensis CIRAD86]|uniref:Uncharacterized protein n=1 Tax=Pseudocercospora fijiensis (strain CIRAD86) TaxID=383855 RepID=M2ZVK4_PSEFD|nr:uncharacterized protein MYCFIDRAFT_203484 [Pseudocercospora fijiensis CIRAD86]EME83024.1 hypothetical protein MYCFIDRAFT_203484 [Pseudocercospora fijiensis CIRAD86]
MNLIVAGALAPVPSPPQPKEPSRSGPGLRLPSFDALGIAAPHPDRFGSLSFSDDNMPDCLGGAIAQPSDAKNPGDAIVDAFDSLASCFSSALTERPQIHPKLPPGLVRTPFHHDVATLTPPAEYGEPTWQSMASHSNPPMHSPSTEPGSVNTHHLEAGRASESPPPASSSLPQLTHTGPEAFINDALTVLLSEIRSSPIPNNPLRVLSHALPSPSTTGHVFSSIIGAIHASTPTPHTEWINVFHAIQGRFNLADLPTSPPSTPGPAVGGDDYFTKKVFDSAVPVSDYQAELSTLPRSPHPVVPPSSINLSIVERYIPPSSTHEFSNMFKVEGPSVLVDRLVELSPNRGHLIFLYPTRTGALRFMQEYLGPIIDPLLRSIQVVNGLSSDLSRTLGNMSAAAALPEFEPMERSLKALCTKLMQRSATMSAFHGGRAAFTVTHASKAEVHLSREAWSRDWWTRQEKPRIRAAMTKYAQEAQKKSSNEYIERAPTPTELVDGLIKGVETRPYPPGQEPRSGIEVAVFVVQRSA